MTPSSPYGDKKPSHQSNDFEMTTRPATEREDPTVDAVWGKLDDDSPNYKNLSWFRASIIMIKSQVSRGKTSADADWIGHPRTAAGHGYRRSGPRYHHHRESPRRPR